MTTPLPPIGPHRDVGGNIIKITDHWIVAVVPMIYNDRIILINRGHWDASGPDAGWCAGYCYDKGPAAIIAALAWNPEDEQHPVGWKKIAGDAR